jgi:hypothetical protein
MKRRNSFSFLVFLILFFSSFVSAYNLSLDINNSGGLPYLCMFQDAICNLTISDDLVVYQIVWNINHLFYKGSGYLDANVSIISDSLLQTAWFLGDNITCSTVVLNSSCFPDCADALYLENITKEVVSCGTTTSTSTTVTSTSTTSAATSTTWYNPGVFPTQTTFDTGTLPPLNSGSLPGTGLTNTSGMDSRIIGIGKGLFFTIVSIVIITVLSMAIGSNNPRLGLWVGVASLDFFVFLTPWLPFPLSLVALLNCIGVIPALGWKK